VRNRIEREAGRGERERENEAVVWLFWVSSLGMPGETDIGKEEEREGEREIKTRGERGDRVGGRDRESKRARWRERLQREGVGRERERKVEIKKREEIEGKR
jgi:hypothetical protein